MSRIDTQAVSVVVARSLVADGEVDLEATPAKPVRITVGQSLELVHAYEFEEASVRIESFRFALAAEADGQRRETEEKVLDRPLVTDDGKGSARLQFRFDSPGKRTIAFRASAAYAVSGRAASNREHAKEGQLTVDVQPAKK